jgi:hypothetical protein
VIASPPCGPSRAISGWRQAPRTPLTTNRIEETKRRRAKGTSAQIEIGQGDAPAEIRSSNELVQAFESFTAAPKKAMSAAAGAATAPKRGWQLAAKLRRRVRRRREMVREQRSSAGQKPATGLCRLKGRKHRRRPHPTISCLRSSFNEAQMRREQADDEL